MDEPDIRYGYMDAVDWQYHLGEGRDPNGAQVYSSLDKLKRDRECVKSCGIVKVKVELAEIIEQGDGT